MLKAASGGDLVRLFFGRSEEGCQLLERGGAIGESDFGAGVCDGWTSVDIAVK